MSIITSALRKAQEKRLRNQTELKNPTQTTASSVSAIVETAKKSSIKKIPHKAIRPQRFFSILLLLIAIFGGIAGILLYINYSSIVAAQKKAAAANVIQSTVKTATVPVPAPIPALPDVAVKKPISLEVKPTRELPILSGVMYSPTSHQAILNGKTVSEGAVIDGFTVKKIYPNSVILVRDSKEFELPIR